MLTPHRIRERLADLERLVREEYKPTHPPKKRDWRTYEEQWAHRIRQVMRDLGPLIREACAFEMAPGPGPKPVLTREQRVILLLLKVLYEQSNRRMAGMLVTFSLLSGLDVSYKTVERLYSDPEVAVALDNLHTLMLRRRGVKRVEGTGDGTGFAVSITQHYATTAAKEKERAKENPSPTVTEKEEGTSVTTEKNTRRFVYSFRILDLRTWLYVAFGTSLRSENAAYWAALERLRAQGIGIDSIRLDRLYSSVANAERFRGARFYIIPKKDVKPHLQHEWLTALREFVERPIPYLEEYYRREHSEAGFSADKRMLGWRIAQRRVDRIDTADRCHSTWHNLFNLYGADKGPSPGGVR